jgi:lipopolysaccharide/colanic/teichoic acid biosynthesis glycosyltransferase
MPSLPTLSLRMQLAAKRALEVALAAALLVLLSPLLVLVAMAVRATSPGEVVFRQRRAGRDGAPFTILKFRTMVKDAPRSSLGSYCYADDPRITPVGRWLRRTSLDELPQLWNVLRGDMSFVGPRPDLPHHVERYTPAQRGRLRARPGMTGWAQVNGRNGLTWDQRIALDLEYLDGWSLARDLRIAWLTVGVVLSRRGTSLPAALGTTGKPAGSMGRK